MSTCIYTSIQLESQYEYMYIHHYTAGESIWVHVYTPLYSWRVNMITCIYTSIQLESQYEYMYIHHYTTGESIWVDVYTPLYSWRVNMITCIYTTIPYMVKSYGGVRSIPKAIGKDTGSIERVISPSDLISQTWNLWELSQLSISHPFWYLFCNISGIYHGVREESRLLPCCVLI